MEKLNWPEDFRWKSNGVLPDWHCANTNEPSDPDTWNDNYFCSRKNIGMRWSSAGPITGMKCTQITESIEPAVHSWTDNYFCVPQDSPLDFQWNSAGPIADKECIQWSEAADLHSWDDNYLCATKTEAG